MCGIVGFTGMQQAAPVLLDGLSKLEYRGYDSAGLAVRNGNSDVEIVKARGRLRVLAEKTNNGAALTGTCGVGHIPAGPPTGNPVKPMRTPIAATTTMWSEYITASLRITRS